MATSGPPRRSPGDDRLRGLYVVALLAAAMWVVEIVDTALGGDLDRHGIEPQDPDGLPGVAAAPFLHDGFGHLVGNTIPFLVLGAVIALSGLRKIVWATVIVIVVGGLGTWLVAPEGTIHIGASGIVFGYASYLIFRGLFSRSAGQLAIGVVVALLYGTTLLIGLTPREGISWQGHLFGALGGVLAAWWLERREPRPSSPAPTTSRYLGNT